MTNFELVKEFMETFGQDVEATAKMPDKKTQVLRYDLIKEELAELYWGMQSQDLVEIADALTDLLYVVYGAGHAYGIDLDSCFKEVHRSNMSKLSDDGKPIYRVDGKVEKGPNFTLPNLHKCINWS
jgi:predicted HAD superfamily Cof-like phosphohydrolase